MIETALPSVASLITRTNMAFGFMWKDIPKSQRALSIGCVKHMPRNKVAFIAATERNKNPFLVSPLYSCPNPGIIESIAAMLGSR